MTTGKSMGDRIRDEIQRNRDVLRRSPNTLTARVITERITRAEWALIENDPDEILAVLGELQSTPGASIDKGAENEVLRAVIKAEVRWHKDQIHRRVKLRSERDREHFERATQLLAALEVHP